MWDMASGALSLGRGKINKMSNEEAGLVCLHLVCAVSSWLPKQLCVVMVLLGEYTRLSMVFIPSISLLLKRLFAHCSWASSLCHSKSGVPHYLGRGRFLSPGCCHRHPLSLQGQCSWWWLVLTKPPNCTLGRQHVFTPCYIYLVSRTAKEIGVQPFMPFLAERWLVCKATLQLS